MDEIFNELKLDFVGPSYNVLGRNCNNFSAVFIERLLKLPAGEGEKLIPSYVNRVVRAAQKIRPCLPALLTTDLRDQLPQRHLDKEDAEAEAAAAAAASGQPIGGYSIELVKKPAGSSAAANASASGSQTARSLTIAERKAIRRQRLQEERRRTEALLRQQQAKLSNLVPKDSPVKGASTARPSSTLKKGGEASSSSSSSSSSSEDEKDSAPPAPARPAPRRPAPSAASSLTAASSGSMSARPAIASPPPAPRPNMNLERSRSEETPTREDMDSLGSYIPFDPRTAANHRYDSSRSIYSNHQSASNMGHISARRQMEEVKQQESSSMYVNASAEAERAARRAMEAERAKYWLTPAQLAAGAGGSPAQQAEARMSLASAAPRVSLAQALLPAGDTAVASARGRRNSFSQVAQSPANMNTNPIAELSPQSARGTGRRPSISQSGVGIAMGGTDVPSPDTGRGRRNSFSQQGPPLLPEQHVRRPSFSSAGGFGSPSSSTLPSGVPLTARQGSAEKVSTGISMNNLMQSSYYNSGSFTARTAAGSHARTASGIPLVQNNGSYTPRSVSRF